MKRTSIFILFVLTIVGIGTVQVGSVDAADPALSRAIFYVA
jgi:hypothetical protein